MTSTRDFREDELRCPCCHTCIMDPVLLTRLQALRDEFDEPLLITSAYRCREHNEAVGGYPKSQHLRGRAVDIAIDHYTPGQKLRLISLVHGFRFKGVGYYKTFIHIDVREGSKSLWVG